MTTTEVSQEPVLDVTAEAADDAVSAVRAPSRPPALSPSRANDFMQCPLLFRFRTVDRLPEPPSAAAARERLYDAPLGERTLAAAHDLLPGEWDRLLEADDRYTSLFTDGVGPDGQDREGWLAGAGSLLGTYFTLEDPNRLEPAERELLVESQLDGGPLLRGIVDRLDVAPTGAVRVVDYKTGKSPRPGYESSAVFQMRFYGLVLWRERGVLPKMLQLVYLGDGQVLRGEPTTGQLEQTEQKIRTIWSAIEDAARTGEWKPRRSKLCGWCAHQSMCPEFGGTPPEIPEGAIPLRLGITV
jgi:putative RecB family exonuclease